LALRRISGAALGLCLAAGAAMAQGRLAFDIPSQPLAAALEVYGDTTGLEVLYNSNLTAGRWSAAVKGAFTPRQGLEALLRGTGLTASYTDPEFFLLLPAPAFRQAAPALDAAAAADLADYYGRIQAGLQDAFCASGSPAPGHYRVAARLWIDASGDVRRFERLGSAGAPSLDRGIDAVLSTLDFGAPPPPGFAQPVTIVIRPQAPGLTMGCPAAGEARR
jgi:Secretin and TonB N terminus short domain